MLRDDLYTTRYDNLDRNKCLNKLSFVISNPSLPPCVWFVIVVGWFVVICCFRASDMGRKFSVMYIEGM